MRDKISSYGDPVKDLRGQQFRLRHAYMDQCMIVDMLAFGADSRNKSGKTRPTKKCEIFKPQIQFIMLPFRPLSRHTILTAQGLFIMR